MKSNCSANLRHQFVQDNVLYLIGDVNYSFVHTLEGVSVLSSRTLKWFGTLWPDFIRPHKNSLVNPVHVQDCVVVSHRQAYLLMRNGVQLPIGRRRIKVVVRQLGVSVGNIAQHTETPLHTDRQ